MERGAEGGGQAEPRRGPASNRLVGMAAIGARCNPGDLLSRVIDLLQEIIQLAGSTLGGALDLARACGAPPPALARDQPLSRSSSTLLAALFSRELEVAGLATEGLSNLPIAEATVSVHLRRIHGKLGVCPRAARHAVARRERMTSSVITAEARDR